MRKTFIFFHVAGDIDIPPLYAESLSEVEDILGKEGVAIKNIWKEELKEREIYEGSIYGLDYKYGYMIDEDLLLFLFSLPSALQKLKSLPITKARRVEKALLNGYVVKELVPTGGLQFAELINRTLYVATEW